MTAPGAYAGMAVDDRDSEADVHRHSTSRQPQLPFANFKVKFLYLEMCLCWFTWDMASRICMTTNKVMQRIKCSKLTVNLSIAERYNDKHYVNTFIFGSVAISDVLNLVSCDLNCVFLSRKNKQLVFGFSSQSQPVAWIFTTTNSGTNQPTHLNVYD